MDKILLISNHVFHYRQKVYNYFFDRFKEDNLEFHVISNSFQSIDYEMRFIKHELPFSKTGYINAIKEIKPKYVILFLHLSDKIMLPIIRYCKKSHISVIYWNHGVNVITPNNIMKNAIFHYIHNQCDALITYTPELKKYLKEKGISVRM